jgi:hypothetical protein
MGLATPKDGREPDWPPLAPGFLPNALIYKSPKDQKFLNGSPPLVAKDASLEMVNRLETLFFS